MLKKKLWFMNYSAYQDISSLDSESRCGDVVEHLWTHGNSVIVQTGLQAMRSSLRDTQARL